MRSGLVSIINNELKDNTATMRLTERDVFRYSPIPFAILLNSVCHSRPVTSDMTRSTCWSDVIAVVSAGLCQAWGHLQRSNGTDCFDVSYRFIHSIGALRHPMSTSFVLMLTFDSGSLYSRPLKCGSI